jgi:peptidoglycan L-alanyl-D-glutamate endopeptidase CwlK|tara:strand:- start:359 stop:742 length:384 start_codon:yes stop_codon:yes gene_type:complete
MYHLGHKSKSHLEGVDSRIEEIIVLALKITRIDFGIPKSGGLRTAEQQLDLYNKGLSRCDGYSLKSYHQSSLAFDVYAYIDGKASWNRNHLTTVATALLQAASQLGYPLTWGGNWESWQDYPHFQLS